MIHFELEDLPPQMREQALKTQQRAQKPAKKPAKYHSVNCTRPAEGTKIKFRSLKEAARFDELCILLNAGEISDLKLQPQFTLQESYVKPNGERIRGMRYTADFSYIDSDGNYIVEDVKSKATRTEQYKMRKKLMENLKHISIKEI